MVLLWIIIPIFLFYSVLIIRYWLIWRSIDEFIPPPDLPAIRISVIIPARNEEKNINALLEALQNQTYPKELYEIIVVDDHSEDRTAEIVNQFSNVKLLSSPGAVLNSHKKKAVETGINHASGQLIVATDADCLPPPGWLETIAAFKAKKQSVFVAAPVDINCSSSAVQLFQAMDFMVLQGITGAVVSKNKMSMCNGANLAYEKKVFEEVEGFAGIDHIASGDDMLLMHKIWKKYPGRVHYLKSDQAIVSTQPVESWKEFFSQRIRWASKARKYDDKRILPVLVLVYLFNLSFFVLAVAGFWNYRYWIAALALWIVKTLVEFPFFISLAVFFNKQWSVKWFFFFQPLHIIYTVISGLFGQSGSYKWKGRKVR
ncbi:MAG TPA: glycosyltransferase [Chitinophagaceae bacterium]|nr:glycosyltransferase [Chitinophagaceae bacterium]